MWWARARSLVVELPVCIRRTGVRFPPGPPHFIGTSGGREFPDSHYYKFKDKKSRTLDSVAIGAILPRSTKILNIFLPARQVLLLVDR